MVGHGLVIYHCLGMIERSKERKEHVRVFIRVGGEGVFSRDGDDVDTKSI